jgi:hypothetical protein
MPVNALLIESLLRFHRFYGPSLSIEFPGSQQKYDLRFIAVCAKNNDNNKYGA